MCAISWRKFNKLLFKATFSSILTLNFATFLGGSITLAHGIVTENWYEDFSYLDHPIRLAPWPHAWSSHPACPSPTLLCLGCHLLLLRAWGQKKSSVYACITHKVSTTPSGFNVQTLCLISLLWTALPFHKAHLLTLSRTKSNSSTTLFCDVYDKSKSHQPLSRFCIYSFVYIHLLWAHQVQLHTSVLKEFPWVLAATRGSPMEQEGKQCVGERWLFITVWSIVEQPRMRVRM